MPTIGLSQFSYPNVRKRTKPLQHTSPRGLKPLCINSLQDHWLQDLGLALLIMEKEILHTITWRVPFAQGYLEKGQIRWVTLYKLLNSRPGRKGILNSGSWTVGGLQMGTGGGYQMPWSCRPIWYVCDYGHHSEKYVLPVPQRVSRIPKVWWLQKGKTHWF